MHYCFTGFGALLYFEYTTNMYTSSNKMQEMLKKSSVIVMSYIKLM